MSLLADDSTASLLPLLLGLAAFGVIALLIGLRAQRARPLSGPEGLIGLKGTALSRLAPGHVGQIFVRGEIWEALPLHGERPIAPEETVAIVRLEGLTARVAPAEAP
jgi:membrane-bound serine protease (ClpP class)